MVLFTCGCIIFALASDMNVVIVGRLFMGLGMGGLDVLQVIILSDITTLRERPLYWGINAIFITLGAASGPLVAGALSEYASWRWLGWINLPIIGIAGFLAIFFLNLKPIRIGLRAKLRRLDWIGMVFYVVGTTFFTAPLSWGGIVYPWSSWKTLLPLLVGVTVLASLIVYEKRAVEPVFPYRLFNNITAIAAIISGFVHGLLMYTFCQYLPLFFQAVFLQTPLQAAISTLPYNIVLVVFSALSGVAVNIARRYCIFLWIGWLLTAVFFGLMCSLDSKIGQSANYAFQAMLGLSLGTVLTVTAIPMQASVKSVDDTGLAAGMLVIFRIFGSLLGLSISSNLFSFVFARNFTPILAALPALEELRSASEAVSFIPSLRLLHLSSETLEGILHIYQKSFQSVWILMTCFAGAGFLVSLLIKELTLEKDDIGRQGLE
jgi:MFS family permease